MRSFVCSAGTPCSLPKRMNSSELMMIVSAGEAATSARTASRAGGTFQFLYSAKSLLFVYQNGRCDWARSSSWKVKPLWLGFRRSGRPASGYSTPRSASAGRRWYS